MKSRGLGGGGGLATHPDVSRASQVAIKTCWQSDICGGPGGGVYKKTKKNCLAAFGNAH